MTGTFVFVDVETTGTDERYHDAWDVAVLYPDEQYEWRFQVPLDHADPAALRIGDYYARTIDGPSFGEAALRTWTSDDEIRPDGHWDAMKARQAGFRLAHATTGVTLVGVNPQFDARFIAKIIRAAGCEPAWAYRLVDLNSMARGYLLGQGRPALGDAEFTPAQILDPRIGSATLSEWCGVDRPDDHTALGDARWARDWFHTIAGDLT